MIIIHVAIHVKTEAVGAFREATKQLVIGSRCEAGNRFFEVLQQNDDATRFLVMEGWESEAAHAAHRDTLHFIKWRGAVNPLMATLRTSKKYATVDWS